MCPRGPNGLSARIHVTLAASYEQERAQMVFVSMPLWRKQKTAIPLPVPVILE